MKKLILKPVIIVFALLAGQLAIADHELIVKPVHGSVEAPDSENHRDRSADVRYRGPYLTTYLAGGYGWGGDVMGRFTDNTGTTERVRSGGGFMFEGGLLAALDRSTMLRLTAGYEVDTTGRDNGYSTFDRVRFDLMLLRNFGVHELGVGMTAHTGVGFHCDINSICAGDVEFDNALGYTLEYALTSLGNEYALSSERRLHPLRTARLGLRFTDIEYQPEFSQTQVQTNDVIDGKTLSLFVGFAF